MKTFRNDSSFWRTGFDTAQKKQRIESIGRELENPQVWQDTERSRTLSQELVQLRQELGICEGLKQQLEELNELAELSKDDQETSSELEKQAEILEQKLKKEEFRIFLSGTYDKANAILTITAGAGGQDAQDWAVMLQRMYERYGDRKGWKVQILHQSFGEQGPEGRIGIKQVVLEIHGPFAYGFLKGENGVHRLVRVSPFSAQSLRHTSFASVEVLPEVDIAKEKEIQIQPEDLQVDFFRSSGPGGQNVNKRETAVRIIHGATGIVVTSQTQRSQQQNKEKALQILTSKLYQLKAKERAKEVAKLKGTQAPIEWGSQIRSYVLHPYKMIKDHRTQVQTSDAQSVLEGNLEEFIEAEMRTGFIA